MGKQVKGFLASDNTFFEREPECKRYEAMKVLEGLCESHGLNFENFIAVLNAWHQQIEGYYNADNKCQQKQIKQGHLAPDFGGGEPNSKKPEPSESPLSSIEDDPADYTVGDKDAPGFLKQQIRGDF